MAQRIDRAQQRGASRWERADHQPGAAEVILGISTMSSYARASEAIWLPGDG
jgi:hypothetical protein